MLTNAKLVYQPHKHERSTSAALNRAKDICTEQNVRLTTTRELVLTLLWQSHQPLGAYQLQDQLAAHLNKRVAPPTVYRAIEFLLKMGLVHRIPSLNAYIGCPFPTSEHSNLFMVCNQCGSVAEVADNTINGLLRSTCDKVNFTLQKQTLELFGLCPQCTDITEALSHD